MCSQPDIREASQHSDSSCPAALISTLTLPVESITMKTLKNLTEVLSSSVIKQEIKYPYKTLPLVCFQRAHTYRPHIQALLATHSECTHRIPASNEACLYHH